MFIRAISVTQFLALAAKVPGHLLEHVVEHRRRAVVRAGPQRAVALGLALGGGLIQLALSIFIAFFLFRDGVNIAGRLTYAVERIGGERGKHLLTVAANTVRGVVYGILGTALAQAIVKYFTP